MDAGPRKKLGEFLAEDIGRGDITSALLPKKRISARIIAKEGGILAGAAHARRIFLLKGCRTRIIVGDGRRIRGGQKILQISGTPQGILSCERTALNLLSRMSGIATETDELARKIPGKIQVYATRKTAPGLRLFDKEAVEIGGGKRHRMSLDEAILIKDNHIAVAGSIEELLAAAKKRHKRTEIEVEKKEDAIIAARAGADVIMLDNFTPVGISRTVDALKRRGLRKKVILEASGGITSKNIARFARTGVDRISVGAITNAARGLDFSLEA